MDIFWNIIEGQSKERKEYGSNSRTRTSKAMVQKEYNSAHRIVKISIKLDKLNYINKLAEEVEEAARNGNMLCDTTGKLSGKYTKPERPVKERKQHHQDKGEPTQPMGRAQQRVAQQAPTNKSSGYPTSRKRPPH